MSDFMDIHPQFGPVLRDDGWVPAPRYLLRRQLVLEKLAKMPVGEVLDIGCGPAVLLFVLSRLGWHCSGLERSERALAMAKKVHAQPGGASISSTPQASWSGRFDCILCMEVLEHIEDDLGALSTWRDWLKPGGTLLLSVPAHMKKWSHSDVWAGHCRRYERDPLQALLDAAGFEVRSLESYGYPLSNIIEPVRAWQHGRALRDAETITDLAQSRREGTDRSGTARSVENKLFPLYGSVVGVAAFRLANWLQRKFLQSDRGTGYLVHATRPA
jgi:SAM-dependent methyltransferase